MPGFEDLEFDSSGNPLYAFVEQNGAVTPRQVWEHLTMDPVEFHHELAILRRDGYLEKRDGKLRVVRGAGGTEEFRDEAVEFAIRPARQEDLSGILGAIREVAGERQYIVAESVAEQLQREGALIRHNRLVSRMFFVALVRDEVVGWAHLEIPQLEKLRHTAELTLGVLETYRRHGIGSHLLQRGLEWAVSNDSSKVYNSLPASNTDAIGFLLDNGFHIEAVRTDHYQVDDGFSDEVMMARTFGGGTPPG